MKNINPMYTNSWKSLKLHYCDMQKMCIADLFDSDANRFSKFSKIFNPDILVDYSKNLITTETIVKLIALAEECDVMGAIKAMFQGEKINQSENRPALHVALRNRNNTPIIVDGYDIMPMINEVFCKMKKFCKNLIEGKWRGYTGKIITDVVHIGIGGSNLGPHMVIEALKPYRSSVINIHFVSNMDGTDIVEVLRNLNPETTLFLIASKTFTTEETMTNACSARDWLLDTNIVSIFDKESILSKHFIALSANSSRVKKFGINPDTNMFEFWEWVGGRYSLWSSVGLPIMLFLGADNFDLLLDGAYAMDLHFKNTALDKNLPVILALIGIWYNNFFKSETEAVFPYDQYMHRFAAYLQQCSMESNGKCVDRDGNVVNYQTGPIVWGESGTNGQHSFYQLIHQGTKMIPCDFIVPAISHNPIADHHIKLVSNFLAQTKALAFGKTIEEIEIEELEKSETMYALNKSIIPLRMCKGNNPSNSILIRKITPYNLGSLISLYEHKVFTQGVIFNIYSFDQWGVELGKHLANDISKELKKNMIISKYDSSTNGLINCYKSWCC